MNIDRIKIKKFSRIVSTQEYADKMKKYGENLIVTAGKQSGGKGTKGRSFSSEKGGVYLSSLLYYPNFPAEKSFLIMAGTCAAVCRTLEEGGLQAKIKWPNDVFVNGKKICGILTENTFSEPAAGDAAEVPLLMTVKFEGDVAAVEAGMQAGMAEAEKRGMLVTSDLISRQAEDTEKMARINALGKDKLNTTYLEEY